MALVTQITLIFLVFFLLGSNFSSVSAATNPDDDSALRSMYTYFGLPPQLTGWSLKGGNPCGSPSWRGVSCCGSRIESINLKGLGVGGIITPEFLSNFTSLKSLDLSKNKIVGNIPYRLPPNVTHIDLSDNDLVGNFPNSLPSLKNLTHLNVSSNLLIGPIYVFKDMPSLKELDVSHNHIIGDLPPFASLTNLQKFHLQNNQFTGCIPEQFKVVPDLRTDGNNFNCGLEPSAPTESDEETPNHTTSNTNNTNNTTNTSSNDEHKHKKWLSTGVLAGITGGVAVVVILILIAIGVCICGSCQSDSLSVSVSIHGQPKK